jgi:hypothetical protein
MVPIQADEKKFLTTEIASLKTELEALEMRLQALSEKEKETKD